MIRGDADANDMLNNTVDVVDFHYNTAKPPVKQSLNKMLGSEDGVITGRSLAELSSIRQSEQQGITNSAVQASAGQKGEAADNLSEILEQQKALKEEIEEQKLSLIHI